MTTIFCTLHLKQFPINMHRTVKKLCDSVIELMLSIMFESTSFSDEIVEQEKKNAKDRIMAMMNDKRQYAVERCIETMFEGENYAISKLGTQEGIDKITADNLKKHYENIITSSIIDIYICGDADANALAEKIKKYTGKNLRLRMRIFLRRKYMFRRTKLKTLLIKWTLYKANFVWDFNRHKAYRQRLSRIDGCKQYIRRRRSLKVV